MIELYISPKVSSHALLKERVEDNHIALRIINDNSYVNPKLVEGKKIYKGINSINVFLDEFELIMQKWHAPICDNYDFD